MITSAAVISRFSGRPSALEVDDEFEFDQFCHRQVGTSRTAGDRKTRSRERQKWTRS
jgi:hypothetical protein